MLTVTTSTCLYQFTIRYFPFYVLKSGAPPCLVSCLLHLSLDLPPIQHIHYPHRVPLPCSLLNVISRHPTGVTRLILVNGLFFLAPMGVSTSWLRGGFLAKHSFSWVARPELTSSELTRLEEHFYAGPLLIILLMKCTWQYDAEDWQSHMRHRHFSSIPLAIASSTRTKLHPHRGVPTAC